MNKYFIILGIFAILLTAGFFSYKTLLNYQNLIEQNQPPVQNKDTSFSQPEQGSKEQEGTAVVPENGSDSRIRMPKASEGKSIVMLIAFKDFRDEEYFVTRQIFKAAGANIFIASSKPGIARGADGGEAPVNLLVKDINVSDFDAVVFIGGPGALQDLDNEDSYRVARDTISQGKLLAAICVSPAILAKAGVLKGKKATVWSSEMDKSAIKILEDNGAIYQNKPVVADGNIITGNGPAASEEFAMKIIEFLP
ncbi:MAG: DJ-1/PfpI family protein [bacterium]|nr:DJ-1/PfpI family protein [bacterium]